MIGCTVTSVVDEIDVSGSGDDVDSETEDQESRANDDADQIVLEVKPELAKITDVHLGSLN